MKYLALLLVLVSISFSAACKGDHDKPTTHTTEPAEAVGKDLMIALSKAKNFHHKARVYMSDGKTAEAIASVREILSLQFPAGSQDAEDVRNDARALLAKLLVGQGQVDEAMRIVQEGLAQSQRESFFVANLYTVKGEIHEARAVQAGSDAAKVVEEKHAAIEAYDRSNAIDTKLQQQLMEGK